MTALAAVIALSSTPLFAQTADVPETTAPATEPAPAPVSADPIAPTAADPLAPKVAPVTPARKATATKTTAARSRPAAPTKTMTARTAAAPVAAPVADPPVEQPLPPETQVAAAPVVTPVDQPGPAPDLLSNDALPIAGAAGLGIVLLAGAGLAVRRRKRRAQEAEDAAWQHDVETAADPAVEPVMAAEPALELTEPAFVAAPAAGAVPVIEDAPVTELPEGFDLSRFGFNVQQAYKGPTPDNPSLSLKHRLRRASGMDQQERKLEAEVEAVTGESPLAEPDSVLAPAAKPALADQAKGDFMFARDRTKSKTSPAYSK